MRAIGSADCALAERAKQLNPHHPGWYWYADFYNAYRQGDYRGALGFALKVNLPGTGSARDAGRRVRAARGARGGGQSLRELLRLRPDFAATVRRSSRSGSVPRTGST